jgi:alkaline phosphatase
MSMIMKFVKLFVILIGIGIFISCQHKENEEIKHELKYVFYFIGDGMGFAHVQLTEAYLNALETDEPGFKRICFDTFPAMGISTTHCNNRLITGSAAAGTALATGFKTDVGRIAISPNGENLTSIAKEFQAEGMKIGIVSSVSINHATPAVFYANQIHRNHYYSIGKQITSSGFNFFGGGGLKAHDSIPDADLYALVESAGYTVFRDSINIQELNESGKIFLVNPVLGIDSEMPYAIDRKYEGGYSLADITNAAIHCLDNERGFFLMVEGGKIDWASHENDAATIVHEVIDFSAAVSHAIEFYTLHPEETLIIVTSDHETGGLALGNSSMSYESEIKTLSNQSMSYYRMQQEYQRKKLSEEDILQAYGFNELSEWESAVLEMAHTPQDNPDYMHDYGSYHPILKSYNRILNIRSGVGFNTWDHTAMPVPVYAIGNGQELFSGKYDNTDIAKKIRKAFGFLD